METLEKHFRALTKPVFQKHGFQQADLLARWPEIAGSSLSAMARPERIRWPRGSEGAKQGGTLVLVAKAGRTLDVQYAAPHILERVNAYLGFGAIAAIKVQASAEMDAPRRAPKRPAQPPQISGIDDPDLQAALARLGQSVKAEK